MRNQITNKKIYPETVDSQSLEHAAITNDFEKACFSIIY